MEPIVLFKLLNYQNGFKTKTHLFNFKTLKNKKFGSLTPIYIKLKLKKTNQLKFITSGGQHKAKHFINIKRGTRKALLSLQNNKNFKSKHITQQNGLPKQHIRMTSKKYKSYALHLYVTNLKRKKYLSLF
jgi:hypothetical protein